MFAVTNILSADKRTHGRKSIRFNLCRDYILRNKINHLPNPLKKNLEISDITNKT